MIKLATKIGFCKSLSTPIVLVLTSMTAFAAINNCPVTTGSVNRTFTGGPAYTGVTIPGSTTGTPLPNSLSGVNAAGGCTAIDLTFSNFAITGSGTNENTLPSLAGTYVSVTPTGTTQTGPDTLLFATIQGTGLGLDNATNDSVDNYKVNNGETFTTTQSYAVADSIGTGIFEVLLTVNDITIAAGGSGSVTIDTCLKGTGSTLPTGNITTQAQCNAAVGGGSSVGVFQSSTITLAQLAAQTTLISFSPHPTYVDVTQVIALTGGSGTNETGFLTLSDLFEETPEPSTFVLFGTALLSVAALRVRKRKQS